MEMRDMMRIFAHRGASGAFPENTLAAFREAAKLPVEGVEFDVHRTKDGVLVINHDEKIHRTSNGKGQIHKLTFEQLRALDFGSWKGQQFAGEKIPTLREVLQIFQHTHHQINIELKTDVHNYKLLEESVIKLLQQFNMLERVLFSSFDHEIVARTLQKAPNNEVGALFSKVLVNLHEYGLLLGTNAIHISLIAAKRGELPKAIQKGSILRVYTVNTEKDYDLMESLGVEAIFTDYPQKMYEYRANKKVKKD